MNTEDNHNEQISCCYKEPKWSGICENHEYGLDVLKNGVIIENIKLNEKSYYIIGRYKTCDLIFDHPSLSRFHSVLQYCSSNNEDNKAEGWYIMDLDSTHGTIINKKRIPSHTFIRVHTGHVIKFGGSTRLYIVTGPEEDKEELSRFTWSELNALKANSTNEKVADANGYLAADDSKTTTGCMWGMSEIIDEEESSTDLKGIVKYKHEDLYRDDPKKAIKIYFEREGFDEIPPYEFTKLGFNKGICRLELPVFGENGEKIVAEVSGSEKKKDLITRCALESCRILDEMDELYKASGLGRRKKKDNKYYMEKDYYSSDEDDFFDRTGQIESKRIQRMKRFGVVSEEFNDVKKTKIEAKNVDSSIVKFNRLEEINDEILSIENQLEEANKALQASENSTEMDEIEQYLEAIQSGTLNKQMRSKLRAKLFELTREENLLRKQLKLSIPVTASMRKCLYQCKQRLEIDTNITKVSEGREESAETTKLKPAVNIANIERAKPKCYNVTQDHVETESDDEEPDVNRSEKNINKSSLNTLMKKFHETEQNDLICDKKKKPITELEDIDGNSDWVPPEGQTGDGRTSLNDKLGY